MNDRAVGTVGASEKPADNGAAPYEATPQEKAAIERFRERRRQKMPTPRFKVEYEGNTLSLAVDHPEEICGHVALADMLATGDSTFSANILEQLANVARQGPKLAAKDLNYALAAVRAIDPQDPTEVLLAVQMVAIHNATIAAARRLNHTETINQQDSASNMLNKLARTFAAQLEALKRYRSTGEQNVRVTHQHVNVNAAQAVVGITQGGGGAQKTGDQPHEPGPATATSNSDAASPALLGHEQADPMPMPSAGREGVERVPISRRTRRRA